MSINGVAPRRSDSDSSGPSWLDSINPLPAIGNFVNNLIHGAPSPTQDQVEARPATTVVSAPATQNLAQVAATRAAAAPPRSTARATAPTLGQVANGAEIRQGLRGPSVCELQERLTQLGYGIARTGVFGPTTADVLKRFQRDHQIQQTGRLGRMTLQALQAAERANRANYSAMENAMTRGHEVRRGENSAAVADLQRALSAAGYSVGTTGQFGNSTELVVKRFQREHNIAQTGRIGRTTWAAIKAAIAELERQRAAAAAAAAAVYSGEGGGRYPLLAVGRDKAPDPYLRALLRTISVSESNYPNPYNVIYGGSTFSDYRDHPQRPIRISSGPNAGLTSDAAGRYQYLSSTWLEKKLRYLWNPLASFTPENQDLVTYKWLDDNGAWGMDISEALRNGRINDVLRRLSGTWTSLGYGIETNSHSDSLPTMFQRFLAEEQGLTGRDTQTAPPTVGTNLIGAVQNLWNSLEFFGWRPSGYNCFDEATKQLEAMGARRSGNGIQVAVAEDGQGRLTRTSNVQDARSYIDGQLAAGKPVMVGVTHADNAYNHDGITDHWIVIVQRGTDANGTFYRYIDSATSSREAGMSPSLKFYVGSNGNLVARPNGGSTGSVVDRRFELTYVCLNR